MFRMMLALQQSLIGHLGSLENTSAANSRKVTRSEVSPN